MQLLKFITTLDRFEIFFHLHVGSWHDGLLRDKEVYFWISENPLKSDCVLDKMCNILNYTIQKKFLAYHLSNLKKFINILTRFWLKLLALGHIFWLLWYFPYKPKKKSYRLTSTTAESLSFQKREIFELNKRITLHAI